MSLLEAGPLVIAGLYLTGAAAVLFAVAVHAYRRWQTRREIARLERILARPTYEPVRH